MELRRQGTMRVIEAALICEIRLPHAKVMNIPHYLNICYNNEEEKKTTWICNYFDYRDERTKLWVFVIWDWHMVFCMGKDTTCWWRQPNCTYQCREKDEEDQVVCIFLEKSWSWALITIVILSVISNGALYTSLSLVMSSLLACLQFLEREEEREFYFLLKLLY